MRKLLFIIFVFFNFLYASNQTFSSGENRVNIIELYTSQGCNSCPPADKWISKLKDNPKLFKEFIPMAFHVTYWNYIGWRDIFSKKANDNRQRYYSKEIWNRSSVYTPQFVINAREYREWFSNKSFPWFEKRYGGILQASLDDTHAKVTYHNKEIKDKNLILNIAILGFDYKIKINAGENKYKTLEHDFVVLNHIQKKVDLQSHKFETHTYISDLIEKDKKQAIAIWISDYDFNILQATGTYITKF